MSSPATDFGVVRVTRDELAALLAAEKERGAVVLRLTSGEEADKAAFFQAVREMLPLDPPLGTYRDVWDALSDSLSGGIGALETPRVVVAWPDADEMRRVHPADAHEAEDVFRFLAETLAEPRFTANRPTALRVYLT
jgi:hypothetical protein